MNAFKKDQWCNMPKSEKMDYLKGLLKKHGLQVTASRIAIAEYVLAPELHSTAEQVKQYLDKSFSNVSLATVYNTLNTFVEIGLLKEVNVPSSNTVIYDSTLCDHYHLYDEEKGEVHDLPKDKVKIDLSGIEGVELSDLDLVFKGKKRD